MPRFVLSALALAVAAAGLAAQTAERPEPAQPVKPLTRQDLDRREALVLYGRAVAHERDNRLVEAMTTYEAARRLDPDAAAIYRALIPIYLALDRGDDALAACRRVLELDPADAETAFLYARQLRAREESAEAVAVLVRAAALPALKEQPDLRAQVHFELGVLYEAAGEWVKAADAYAVAADVLDHPAVLLEDRPYSREEIDAQAADTHERRGRVLLRAGRSDDAIAAFRRAQQRDPARAPRLAFNLAQVLREQGRPREALESVNEYLRTQPQGTEGYELKVDLLRKLNRGGDVIPELVAAAGRDAHNTALQLFLAREYRRARRPSDAERIYLRLLGETAPSPEVYAGLFELYKDDPRTGGERALKQLDDAVKAAVGKDDLPADPATAAAARAILVAVRDDAASVRLLLEAAHRWLLANRSLTFQTRVLLAGLASRSRQLDLAEELYRSCLRRPGGLGALEQEVYAGLLRVLSLARKYDAVVAVCKQGLDKAQATNRVLFHVDLAHALTALGRDAEALAAADAAVNESADKDRLLCRRVKVQVLAQAGKFDAAAAECQALLREYNQPGEVRDVRALLSSVYSLARDYPRAEEQLRLILDADPDDAGACNDLGYLWADQNKHLDEAERLIRKALELDRRQRTGGKAVGLDADRDNAAYVDSLGWVLFRKGDLAGARRELERAAALPQGADDPVVWDHLGDVYFRQGEPARAASAWRKAVELYDAGARRKTDERYGEIKHKLKRHAP